MKCEPHRNVSQPGPRSAWGPLPLPARPALGASPLALPLGPLPLGLLSGRWSVRHVSWQKPYLEEVMKLFSMQRTMKAWWQLTAFCSSSLPVSSEEAWPVAVAASVRHVSQ